MLIIDNLVVLTPLMAGLVTRFLVRRRLRSESDSKAPESGNGPWLFSYSRTYLDIVFYCGFVVPIMIFILPDSIVLDVRILFNIFAVVCSLLLFFTWAYLRNYRIIVDDKNISFGAFWIKTLDLCNVTSIKYHWVNNGMYLKVFSGQKIIAKFEGGVSNFDSFAKCVRAQLPKDIQVEIVGKAHF